MLALHFSPFDVGFCLKEKGERLNMYLLGEWNGSDCIIEICYVVPSMGI